MGEWREVGRVGGLDGPVGRAKDSRSVWGLRLLLSEVAPGFFFEDVDEFVAFGADAGAEGDHEVGGLVADVEGGVHLVFGNEDGVAGAEDLFFLADPLFDLAADASDDFFLVGMLVKIVAFAGEEFDVDDGEVLAVSSGGAAEPSEFSPVEFFGGRF